MSRKKANKCPKTIGDINANDRQYALDLGKYKRYISSLSTRFGYQSLSQGTYTYKRSKQTGHS